MKNIRIFVSENCQVFGGESFYILNRHVFVMLLLLFVHIHFIYYFYSIHTEGKIIILG